MSTAMTRMAAAGILAAAALASCGAQKPAAAPAAAPPFEGKKFRVAIVMDTVDDWSSGIRDGFEEGLRALLERRHAEAVFEVMDTKLDPAEAAKIAARLEAERPDLCCMVCYPDGFADRNITRKLAGKGLRFVAEDCIPVESGTIASWAEPGGDVAGVGVFVQLNSALRILKKIDPSARVIHGYSWDQMKDINAWWGAELARACREEGFELAEFRMIPSVEAEAAMLREFAGPRRGAAVFGCISAFVHADGSPAADAEGYINPIIQGAMTAPYIGYEDTTIAQGALMGACVVWRDVGAQLADLALRVLGGEAPGSIPWEYPRKYNLIVNKKTADRLGIALPREIIDAAYRIYTDYAGDYMGRAD